MVTDQLVRRDDPFYTQIWNRMTSPPQKAVLALIGTLLGKHPYV
jgi:hypothetical protein